MGTSYLSLKPKIEIYINTELSKTLPNCVKGNRKNNRASPQSLVTLIISRDLSNRCGVKPNLYSTVDSGMIKVLSYVNEIVLSFQLQRRAGDTPLLKAVEHSHRLYLIKDMRD